MNQGLLDKVSESFTEKYHTDPLLVFSPGRINLIGEHTDYNEGFVFPAAIDKGIMLAIQKSDADTSQVLALDKKEHYAFDTTAIVPVANGGWRNYILGVVAEIQNLGLKVKSFNSVFAGNIPAGAGLSSSAALENSFVFGLNTLFDLRLSKRQMITISQKAEHHFAGVKCGIMDQYASMFGVEDSALLLDCRSISSKAFQIDFKDYELLLVNSNVKHDLVESAYNDRRAVCEQVSAQLDVPFLRDVTKTVLRGIRKDLSTEDYDKALYIVEENERVLAFSKAILDEDLQTLGTLLYQSHEGMRDKFKISCKELDFLVDITVSNPHILGARMMGGGFGGCTINLILSTAVEDFKKQISQQYVQQFGWECSIYSVKLSKGTRLSK